LPLPIFPTTIIGSTCLAAFAREPNRRDDGLGVNGASVVEELEAAKKGLARFATANANSR
jgi:hypothetical protein